MNLVSALLALLLPAATEPESLSGIDQASLPFEDVQRWPAAQQVRIEQRITIRIAPRRSEVTGLPLARRPEPRRFTERHMSKCLPIASIGGVGVSSDNRLLLYLRDDRLISASLERACRARDFYSGFYLERHADGKLCVDRDTLLSRSGANCKLTRMRRLVEEDD